MKSPDISPAPQRRKGEDPGDGPAGWQRREQASAASRAADRREAPAVSTEVLPRPFHPGVPSRPADHPSGDTPPGRDTRTGSTPAFHPAAKAIDADLHAGVTPLPDKSEVRTIRGSGTTRIQSQHLITGESLGWSAKEILDTLDAKRPDLKLFATVDPELSRWHTTLQAHHNTLPRAWPGPLSPPDRFQVEQFKKLVKAKPPLDPKVLAAVARRQGVDIPTYLRDDGEPIQTGARRKRDADRHGPTGETPS